MVLKDRSKVKYKRKTKQRRYNLRTDYVPMWLQRIPPGVYMIRQLEDMSGKSRGTIRERLNALGIVCSYRRHEQNELRLIPVWHWEGYKAWMLKRKSGLEHLETGL
jgi:hypothetical protein